MGQKAPDEKHGDVIGAADQLSLALVHNMGIDGFLQNARLRKRDTDLLWLLRFLQQSNYIAHDIPGVGGQDAAAAVTLAAALASTSSEAATSPLLRLVSPLRSHLEELKPIGKGGFGRVYMVRSRVDGRVMALKKVPFKSSVPPWAPAEVLDDQQAKILREVRALARLEGHPHVVQYYTGWVEPNWEQLAKQMKKQESQKEPKEKSGRKARASSSPLKRRHSEGHLKHASPHPKHSEAPHSKHHGRAHQHHVRQHGRIHKHHDVHARRSPIHVQLGEGPGRASPSVIRFGAIQDPRQASCTIVEVNGSSPHGPPQPSALSDPLPANPAAGTAWQADVPLRTWDSSEVQAPMRRSHARAQPLESFASLELHPWEAGKVAIQSVSLSADGLSGLVVSSAQPRVSFPNSSSEEPTAASCESVSASGRAGRSCCRRLNGSSLASSSCGSLGGSFSGLGVNVRSSVSGRVDDIVAARGRCGLAKIPDTGEASGDNTFCSDDCAALSTAMDVFKGDNGLLHSKGAEASASVTDMGSGLQACKVKVSESESMPNLGIVVDNGIQTVVAGCSAVQKAKGEVGRVNDLVDAGEGSTGGNSAQWRLVQTCAPPPLQVSSAADRSGDGSLGSIGDSGAPTNGSLTSKGLSTPPSQLASPFASIQLQWDGGGDEGAKLWNGDEPSSKAAADDTHTEIAEQAHTSFSMKTSSTGDSSGNSRSSGRSESRSGNSDGSSAGIDTLASRSSLGRFAPNSRSARWPLANGSSGSGPSVITFRRSSNTSSSSSSSISSESSSDGSGSEAENGSRGDSRTGTDSTGSSPASTSPASVSLSESPAGDSGSAEHSRDTLRSLPRSHRRARRLGVAETFAVRQLEGVGVGFSRSSSWSANTETSALRQMVVAGIQALGRQAARLQSGCLPPALPPPDAPPFLPPPYDNFVPPDPSRSRASTAAAAPGAAGHQLVPVKSAPSELPVAGQPGGTLAWPPGPLGWPRAIAGRLGLQYESQYGDDDEQQYGMVPQPLGQAHPAPHHGFAHHLSTSERRWPYMLCICMELVRGPTLDSWMLSRVSPVLKAAVPPALRQPRTRLPPAVPAPVPSCAQELEIFRQLVRGVASLHARGVIHRDLKPSNVFITTKGGSGEDSAPDSDGAARAASLDTTPAKLLVKIADLGLAAFCGPGSTLQQELGLELEGLGDARLDGWPEGYESSSSVPRTSGIGTMTYAAPEQVEGDGDYSYAVDIYPLGLILVELLCPFDTGMERAMAIRAAKAGALPPSMLRGYPELAELAYCMLSPDPSRRPTAQQLLGHPSLRPGPQLSPQHSAVKRANLVQQGSGRLSPATPTPVAKGLASAGYAGAAAPVLTGADQAADRVVNWAGEGALCADGATVCYRGANLTASQLLQELLERDALVERLTAELAALQASNR